MNKKCFICKIDITHPSSVCISIPLLQEDIGYKCPKCFLEHLKFSIKIEDEFVESMGGWDSVNAHHQIGFIGLPRKNKYEETLSLLKRYESIVAEIELVDHAIDLLEEK